MKPSYFFSIQEKVRPELDRRFEAWVRSASQWNIRLKESAMYSFIGGGKALRPTLIFWSYFLTLNDQENFRFSDLPESAWNMGLALEMIHTYSLIHDDLPAMDNDDLRRGKASSHKAFGEALAILTGDTLLTNAFELVSEAQMANPSLQLEVVNYLARCAGGALLIGGQVRDLTNQDRSFHDLELTHKQKTGALFSFALYSGAMATGRDIVQKRREALKNLGFELGYFFQLSDDLLDVRGDPLKMGKTAQKDKNQGKAPVRLFSDQIHLDREMTKVRDRVIDLCGQAFEKKEIAKTELNLLMDYFLKREK
jgi:geranylgeranyl pyrophosphate synthase